jgi:multidrug transporter EmrE-like cation transporter
VVATSIYGRRDDEPLLFEPGTRYRFSTYGWILLNAVADAVPRRQSSQLVMLASFALLSFSMKTLPLGTAYTVWTGIGAVGAFVVGVLLLVSH